MPTFIDAIEYYKEHQGLLSEILDGTVGELVADEQAAKVGDWQAFTSTGLDWRAFTFAGLVEMLSRRSLDQVHTLAAMALLRLAEIEKAKRGEHAES